MSRRSGLGKGLSSLIPAAPTGVAVDGSDGPLLSEVAVGDIAPNPHQPRVHFDEESLADLAKSIAQIGVLQPVLVRRVDDGYQLIAGERRWRAAKRAGLTTIPAIVRGTDGELGAIEEALVENLHRQDLTALEEAAAYQQLIDDFELTHDRVAERVGKSRSAITNTLRLLGLPPEVQRLLADGKLTAGHGRALLATGDRALQEQLGRQAAADGWTVRATEEAVKRGGADDDETTVLPLAPVGGSDDGDGDKSGGSGTPPGSRLRPPGLLELEQLLADHLDTRVGVQMGAKHGKVSIDFADLEDLERIYRRIVGEQ